MDGRIKYLMFVPLSLGPLHPGIGTATATNVFYGQELFFRR